MSGEVQYVDGQWQSPDGLTLHYRDYPGPKKRPPILCLPGLSRNCRDFEDVAARLSGQWRVIAVDLRGRGESMYAKNPESYRPDVYVEDVEALLRELKIRKFVAIGTSLGGLLTALLAARDPKRIAAAVINDIGPVIESVGLERIKSYVGRAQSWPTWVHAARNLQDVHSALYPEFGLVDWIKMAKRWNKLTMAGRIVPDYDPKISENVRSGVQGQDLWPSFRALDMAPVTILRGALSDILSETTAKQVVRELPNARLVTVPNVGHAPSLEEPQSRRAIDTILKAVAG